MEIPSSGAGVFKELKLKRGDKVGEGSVVVMLEAAVGQVAQSKAAPALASAAQGAINPVAVPAAPVSAPGAASLGGSPELECDVLVLGAGGGGRRRSDSRRSVR